MDPADMLAFFEEKRKTDPHLAAARFINPERYSIDGEQSLAEETSLQNENIRRWFERWHRDALPQPEEGGQ
jgi:hypothetical protein